MLALALSWDPATKASKGGMKVGRIKDPLYEDPLLGLPHLPSSYLLRPLNAATEAARPPHSSAPRLHGDTDDDAGCSFGW